MVKSDSSGSGMSSKWRRAKSDSSGDDVSQMRRTMPKLPKAEGASPANVNTINATRITIPRPRRYEAD